MIWRDRCLIEGPPSGAVISIGAKSGRPRAVTAAACNAPANRPGCSTAKPLSRCPASSRYVRRAKPAVLSLVPGASRRKADSRHVRSGWLADLGPRRDRLTIARPEASKVR